MEGKIERIGLPGATFIVKGMGNADNLVRPVKVSNHTEAVVTLMDWIVPLSRHDPLSAVGHRMVYGGPKYGTSQRITPEMVTELRCFSPFEPEHLPEEIQLIRAFQHRFPELPQFACFDSGFHNNMPRIAQLLPIPRRYEQQGLRRYGFHGLSYEFLMKELATMDGEEAAQGRVILAHLGSGASLCAVHGGRSMDTSMSFTPTSGVPMGTRSGDMDPGLILYLARSEKMTAKQVNEMVNLKSGLLGVSETSSDMRDLLDREADDIRAAEAVAMFCYHVKKYIGAFAAVLGGVETLIFTGGIGENAPLVRSRICAGLEFLGIVLDEQQNSVNGEVVSPKGSRVAVRVIHTDEELMIAQLVCHELGLSTIGEQSCGGSPDRVIAT